jgi:hypothetical protein
MTDFRALCKELLNGLDGIADPRYPFPGYTRCAMDNARAALAEQPVGPTDEELLELSQFHDITYCVGDGSFIQLMQGGEDISDDVVSFARAVLARWSKS